MNKTIIGYTIVDKVPKKWDLFLMRLSSLPQLLF